MVVKVLKPYNFMLVLGNYFTFQYPHKYIKLVTDELIRQVTINCAERGLLLLRVRDEIRMTVAAFQTLYESSVAFGMRKALQSEQGKSEMEQKVQYINFCTQNNFYLL